MITLDFESYYDKDFSLSKLTTEEYVRGEQFETIGVAVKVNDAPTQWFSGSDADTVFWLHQFDWANHFVLAHNAMFDAAILTWRYGIRPKAWLDTLSMARALLGPNASVGLAKLALHFGLGQKGTEVDNAKGKRRADFTTGELYLYGNYCVNDVDLTYALYKELNTSFPTKEKRLIDITIRMFSDPVLELDIPRLNSHLSEVHERKQKLFVEANITPEVLNSNKKFATLLESMGVYPPMKISPTTEKETYAFAKSDEYFVALLDHEDERVQAVVAARLGAKSTLEQTRTQRFIEIAGRAHDHKLPIPLKFYAAHTGRWGGADSVNLQNLPSRGIQGNKLKRCIVAPKGHVIIDCDSSQIEARVLAWLAGQLDLLQLFADKQDVYKYMASLLYRKDINDIDDAERFIGKTTVLGCFGADTLVLTDTGWKRIIEVQSTDKVWDGEEWVTHMGVVSKGELETIRAWGVDATPEHEILTEHGWREWHEVVTNPSLSQSAFAKARLLSRAGNSTLNQRGVQRGGTRVSNVIAVGAGLLTAITSKLGAPLGVVRAAKSQRTQSVTGPTSLCSQMKHIVRGYLIASRRAFLAATTHLQKPILTTAGGASLSTSGGAETALHSLNTYLPLQGGTTSSETSTGLITIRGTNPVTYGLLHVARTRGTNEPLASYKRRLQTYDIAYAGPRNRFLIATDAGPLIVHNCGYGMGAVKFQLQLRNMGKRIDLDTCKHIIKHYRLNNNSIAGWWNQLNTVLDAMMANKPIEHVDKVKLLELSPFTGIKLPNGMYLNYPELKRDTDGQYSYATRYGVSRIYGGKVAENLCQAVARCIIGEQMIEIEKRYRVVLTVHDAIACVVPIEEGKEAQAYIENCMRTSPSWATGLPLNCESGMALTYGDC